MAEKKIKAKPPGKAATTNAAKSTKVKPVKKVSGGKAILKSAKKNVTFKLQAPEAIKVFVAGCFNDWDPNANPLERDQEGIWTCTLFLEAGEYEYRFIVDDVWWDDPLNLMRRQNEFYCENCILIV